jgi:hypothetical protein
MGCKLDDRGSIPGRRKFFLYSTASRTVLEPTRGLIQGLPDALSLGIKWPGHEADSC